MIGLTTLADYSYTTTSSGSHFNGAILGLGVVGYLVGGFIMGKLFVKAGRPMWAAFVPLYNSWVLAEVAGKPGWWGLAPLLGVIPVVGTIGAAIIYLLIAMALAERFGKSVLFGVIGLWFFAIVGYIILAFGSAKYQAPGTSKTVEDTPYPKN